MRGHRGHVALGATSVGVSAWLLVVLPVCAAAAPNVRNGEFRVQAQLVGGVETSWSFSASFYAADTIEMDLTPPGREALALIPNGPVPDAFPVRFEIHEEFASRDDLLAAFPSGTYVVRIADNGARASFPVPTSTLDGVVVITHPQDEAQGVESEPVITRERTCASCDEELAYLAGVDGTNWNVFGYLFREERLPASYTLADFDWGMTPVTSLPDGEYELELTALAEAWEDGRFDNGDEFDLYARAAATDVCRFSVPAPSPSLQAFAALAVASTMRRRRCTTHP